MILKLSNNEDWAYCSTEENPADLGSRGVLASQLKGNQLWGCGPAWLTKQPEDWTVTTESFRIPESLIEEKKTVIAMLTGTEVVTGISSVIDINDYSSLQRLVRVTAWVKRFLHNTCAKERRTGRLEVHELKGAEIEWLKSEQVG